MQKYIITLVVIIAIGTGLFFLQKNRQSKELKAHQEQQMQRIIGIAKKSSPAGVLTMATAINKFYDIKGQYPAKLIQLYPDFIPDKAFITDLNWKYSHEKNNFLLQRSAGKGLSVASIGPDLKLETGDNFLSAPAGSIASAHTEKSQKKGANKSKSSGSKTKQSAEDKINIPMIAKLPPKHDSIDGSRQTNKRSNKKLTVVSVVRKKINKHERFLLSLDGDGYYIWKSSDGTIGFSNIQYPDDKKLAYYSDENWIQYIEKTNIQ